MGRRLHSKGSWTRHFGGGSVQACAFTNIDNTLVSSSTWEEHLSHLRWVPQAHRQAGLTANQKEGHLGRTTVEYLGFKIGQGRVWALPGKVEAVGRAEPPLT